MLFFIFIFFCRKIQILCSVWFSLTLFMASFCWQSLRHCTILTPRIMVTVCFTVLLCLSFWAVAASFQQGNVTFYLFAQSQSKMQMNYTQNARPYAQSELVLTQVRHVTRCFALNAVRKQVKYITWIQFCILILLIIGSRSYSIYSYLKVTQKIHGLH